MSKDAPYVRSGAQDPADAALAAITFQAVEDLFRIGLHDRASRMEMLRDAKILIELFEEGAELILSAIARSLAERVERF